MQEEPHTAYSHSQMMMSCFLAQAGPRRCLLSSNSFFSAAVNCVCSLSICSCEGVSLFSTAGTKNTSHIVLLVGGDARPTSDAAGVFT